LTETLNHLGLIHFHLPEWRDSHAVTQQVGLALNKGYRQIFLTGARGDRLLLAGLSGPWEAEVRIDGDVGTEFARGLNASGLFVLVNGSSGAGVGYGLKAGTLVVAGKSGAMLGTHIEGGEIWALGFAGSRLAHCSKGGRIVVGNGIGPMAMDRRISGTLTIRAYPHPAEEAQLIAQKVASILAWPEAES
jgi:glutamate synthase domain-containing protein 3